MLKNCEQAHSVERSVLHDRWSPYGDGEWSQGTSPVNRQTDRQTMTKSITFPQNTFTGGIHDESDTKATILCDVHNIL